MYALYGKPQKNNSHRFLTTKRDNVIDNLSFTVEDIESCTFFKGYLNLQL